VSKADELFDLALSLAMYVFIMIVIIASIKYYGNWISEQLAMTIIVGGALGFTGAMAFGMMICELANTRRLKTIDNKWDNLAPSRGGPPPLRGFMRQAY